MSTPDHVEEETPPAVKPEVLGPCSPVPFLPPDLMAARLEDPEFGEVLGRARALAKGEPYDPAKHYPHRPTGRSLTRVTPEVEERIQAVIERFNGRARRNDRYLWLER